MSSSSGGGWLTTKKKGRDDDQIARDKQQALEKRKRRRATANKPRAQKKPPPAKRKAKVSYDSDDDDDEDSFIADDDASLSEDDASVSEEEEEDFDVDNDDDVEDVTPKQQRGKPPKRNRLLAQHDKGSKKENYLQPEVLTLDDDDDDDSDDSTGFLSETAAPVRTSKPISQRKGRMAVAAMASRRPQPNKAQGDLQPFASSKNNPFAKYSYNNHKKKKNRGTSNRVGLDSETSDENNSSGLEEVGVLGRLKSSTSKAAAPANKTKGANNKKKNHFDESSDEGIHASDSEEEEKRSKKRKNWDYNSDDYDEELAVALALDESQKEADARERKNKKRKIAHDDDEEEENAPFREWDEDSHPSDDDNEGVDDGLDDYHDTEDARTAASVLKAANDLSVKVLKSMQKWVATGTSGSVDNGSNHKKVGETATPVGIIIQDGALALGNLSTSKAMGQEPLHSWISEETMKQVVPKVTLADYQLIGVNWMALLHGMQVPVKDDKSRRKKSLTNVNGILADEMGLGKTCQTISFLAWLRYQREQKDDRTTKGTRRAAATAAPPPPQDVAEGLVNSDEESNHEDDEEDDVKPTGVAEGYVYPHLVVCPASVISNWMMEFEKFAPHLRLVKYHGTQAERSELKEQLRLHFPRNAVSRKRKGEEPLDVILAPVTYFQKEKSDDQAFLRQFKFSYLVIDEGHLLKNSRGLRYMTLDKLDTQHRLLLTGTPVQNSPQELMSLLTFLMPLFSRKVGGDDYADDSRKNDGGESMLQHFVSLEAVGGAVDDAAAYRKLKQLFAPFVLRRKKSDVLSQIMPPKVRKTEEVELDSVSRSIYDSIMSDHLKARKNGKTKSNFDHVFTQLRKAAHHPLLLRTRHTAPKEVDRLVKLFQQYSFFKGEGATTVRVKEELGKMNDFEIHLAALELLSENAKRHAALSPYVLKADDLFASAKFVRLRTLLPELIKKGHRILIFSIWTSCLDLLSCLLEHMGITYLRMDGSTAVSERQDLINRFSSDTSIPIFLLSTKACGLGLNIVAADTCIMHDIDFNPFNDLQAEDRVHRIGQTKTTTVIKMVTKDTVDSDIFQMQQRKARMNAALMDASAAETDDDWADKNVVKQRKEKVMKTAIDRFLTSSSPAAATKKFATKSQMNDLTILESSSDEDQKPKAAPVIPVPRNNTVEILSSDEDEVVEHPAFPEHKEDI